MKRFRLSQPAIATECPEGAAAPSAGELKTPGVMGEWPRQPRDAPASSFLPFLLSFPPSSPPSLPRDAAGRPRGLLPRSAGGGARRFLAVPGPAVGRGRGPAPSPPRQRCGPARGRESGPALTRLSAPPSLFADVTNAPAGVTSWDGPEAKEAEREGKHGGARGVL